MTELVVPPGTRLLRDSRDRRVADLDTAQIGLVGVPWDWAMTGRPGARMAPGEVRRALYGLATWSPVYGALPARPVDLGDARVVPGDWGETRRRLYQLADALYHNIPYVLWLGGDHSISEPLIEPLLQEGCLGLLLLDAHYDMRSVDEGLTSGAWLWNLASRHPDRIRAAIVGVGEYQNPPYLHERAVKAGFRVVPSLQVLAEGVEPALEAVDWLAGESCTSYYVSVDMDHLDQAYAPGVNAPSSLGLRPEHTITVLSHAVSTLRPRAADIVEVVPPLDRDGATVRLAALVAARIIHAWAGRAGAGGEEF